MMRSCENQFWFLKIVKIGIVNRERRIKRFFSRKQEPLNIHLFTTDWRLSSYAGYVVPLCQGSCNWH